MACPTQPGGQRRSQKSKTNLLGDSRASRGNQPLDGNGGSGERSGSGGNVADAPRSGESRIPDACHKEQIVLRYVCRPENEPFDGSRGQAQVLFSGGVRKPETRTKSQMKGRVSRWFLYETARCQKETHLCDILERQRCFATAF